MLMRVLWHIRKFWWLYLVLLILLYLIIGAAAPFAGYKELTEESRQAADQYLETGMERLNAGEEGPERVMLLEDNDRALTERLRLIEQAGERIIFSTFDMRPDEAAEDVAAMLLHKADEGVQISLLIDGFNGTFRMPGEALFYALSTHPNIEVRQYSPVNILTPWTSQGRMHDKYMVVDDLAYILGGRNIFNYFLGEHPGEPKGYDREVLVYNTEADRVWESNAGQQTDHAAGQESSLEQVEDYFYKVWDGGYCKTFGQQAPFLLKKKTEEKQLALRKRYEELCVERPEIFEPYDYAANTYAAEGVLLLSGQTGIYGKEPVVFYELCELMKQAKERVLIHTPYTVCNSYMYTSLKEVGEAVPGTVMMINSVENGDNFCASSDYLFNKEQVVKTGLALYEYDGGNSYHGKTAVIDNDISIIGSYNFDLRSTYVDTELMLVIKSEELTTELTGYMEEMQTRCRRVISAEEYETPENLDIGEIPGYKRFLMKAFGLIAQPFRYLL